ncbi:poly(A) polymerase I-like isoform X2 [Populus alba x Populus x berolinensis]|nr:poly(A) polymerase I-like isoform X2 [Populus alba x Populus x berolinensis]
MISRPTRVVLNGLKKKGYEVYLVGGCVRDLILKRIPKDFDVITSAELKQVRKAFHRCEIVGKRFPICHVHVDDAIVEVSSFSTSQLKSDGKFNGNVRKPRGCSERDFIRWRNCLQRDFTINGLMLDPYASIVYDYMGGITDIKKTKVRTIIPANLSFVEDSGCILRAIRIAARLHFGFTRDLALSLKELSHSVLRLDKGRILVELNYMLAYGSAEASLRLMWRFGLLEILLPIQSLFSNLDRLVAPDRPCHSSLWLGIFAFHKALVDQPQDPLVVTAFSLAVHSGGSLLESVEIARRISQPYQSSFPELLEARNPDSNNALVHKTINFAALVKTALCNMTDGCYVSKAMAKYPKAPSSELVFIPMALFLRVSKIFECVRRGMEARFVHRQGRKIDYESLAMGSLEEVRHVFARIVFDTVYPPNQSNENNVANQRP